IDAGLEPRREQERLRVGWSRREVVVPAPRRDDRDRQQPHLPSVHVVGFAREFAKEIAAQRLLTIKQYADARSISISTVRNAISSPSYDLALLGLSRGQQLLHARACADRGDERLPEVLGDRIGVHRFAEIAVAVLERRDAVLIPGLVGPLGDLSVD